MMWEIFGWISAACLSVLVITVTVSVVVNLAKQKPRDKTNHIYRG